MNLIKRGNDFLGLNKGHQRSIKAKKNILSSFVIKGLNIILNLLYVPILIDYLGQEEYGVWLTISSVVTWFGFFDIGFGNGLRNMLAIAKAKNNDILARKYVSTTYAILSIIGFSLAIFFILIAKFINWNTFFNTNTINSTVLLFVVLIVFISFFIRFVLQLIGIVLLADQRPAYSNAFNLIANAVALLIIIVLKATTRSNLIQFSLVLSGVPLFVFLIFSFYLYNGNYKKYSPSLKFIDFSLLKNLLGLGVKFFFIQITDIIIYASTNLLITNFIGPAEVVVYNIAYKLFAVSTMVFSIILTPLWSAITEAYTVDDMEWIKRTVWKIQKIGMVISLIVMLVLLFAPIIYNIWIGDRVIVPFQVSLIIAVTSILKLLLGVYVSFQNGIGKIKIVLYLCFFQAIFYIPLAYLLGKICELGIVGIVLAGILIEIPMRVQQVVQYYKIANRKASGLWIQ